MCSKCQRMSPNYCSHLDQDWQSEREKGLINLLLKKLESHRNTSVQEFFLIIETGADCLLCLKCSFCRCKCVLSDVAKCQWTPNLLESSWPSNSSFCCLKILQIHNWTNQLTRGMVVGSSSTDRDGSDDKSVVAFAAAGSDDGSVVGVG